MSRTLISLFVLMLLAGPAAAQTAAAPDDAAKALVGAWEISNASREKACAVALSADPAGGGLKLEFDPKCASVFPAIKEVVAWTLSDSALRLIDAGGKAVFEFTEVEAGMYEGERPGEGLYFLQSQAALKASLTSADLLVGQWGIVRGEGKPICLLTLSSETADADNFSVAVKPGCDAAIAGFGLTAWRVDRSELILTGRGGIWRFEESDTTTWQRIPPTAERLLLVRQ